MGGARLSGVHNGRQFLDRALAPEVIFPSPQWLKPAHFRISNCTAEFWETVSDVGGTGLKSATGNLCSTTSSRGRRRCQRNPDSIGRQAKLICPLSSLHCVLPSRVALFFSRSPHAENRPIACCCYAVSYTH